MEIGMSGDAELRRAMEFQIERSGYDSLRQTLRKQRGRVGLTQRALADAVGINRSTIAQWELGQARLEIGDLLRIGRALEAAFDERQQADDDAFSIKGLREALGLSQSDAAKLANVRQTTISRAESDDSRVSEATRNGILKALTEEKAKRGPDYPKLKLLMELTKPAARTSEAVSKAKESLQEKCARQETHIDSLENRLGEYRARIAELEAEIAELKGSKE
jgi:transcriptional regulator with XRE-family HTH domain